jgi:hypothetical protein
MNEHALQHALGQAINLGPGVIHPVRDQVPGLFVLAVVDLDDKQLSSGWPIVPKPSQSRYARLPRLVAHARTECPLGWQSALLNRPGFHGGSILCREDGVHGTTEGVSR